MGIFFTLKMINGLHMKGCEHVLIKFLVLLLWIQDITGHDELTCFTLAPMTHVNIGCPAGSRILITSAIYGASPFGLCYGTGKDCTQEVPLPMRCCGRQTCTFDVRNRYLTKCMQPATYYQVYYMCVKGEVECQDTDVTEDLPLKEIDKTSAETSNNNVGGPSTRIFILNERADNDTEGTTGPTPRDFGDDIKSTTFPGLNLMLTPQLENDMFKTQTESPLDNKTTKKRIGTLHFSNKDRKHENGRSIEDLDGRFLRRRGQIWRIKGEHDDNPVETSSALTPTRAVTINKDRRFRAGPFPGRNIRYYERHAKRQQRFKQEENRSDERKEHQQNNQQRQHHQHHNQQQQQQEQQQKQATRDEKPEYRKRQYSPETRYIQRELRILPKMKKEDNLFHATTPVDQLQVLRMMANIIYKPGYKRKGTKEENNRSIQRQDKGEEQISDSKSTDGLENREQFHEKPDYVKRVVERTQENNQFQETDDHYVPFDKSNTSSNQSSILPGGTQQQESNYPRDSHSMTDKINGSHEDELRDRDIYEGRQKDQAENNVRNADGSDDEEARFDEVTPPTFFRNRHDDLDDGDSKVADVEENRDGGFNKLFENILSNTRSAEQPVEAQVTTPQPETTTTRTTRTTTTKSTPAPTTPTRTRTTSSTSTSGVPLATESTTIALINKVTKNINDEDTKRNTKRYGDNSKVTIKGNSDSIGDNNRDNSDGWRRTSQDKKMRNKYYRKPSGQNIRRHLSEPDPGSHVNNGMDGKTQTVGTQQVTLFTPAITKDRPIIRWDGRHSTIADWLKTLRPTYPPLQIGPVTLQNEVSTVLDNRHLGNHDITPKIYQPNRNAVSKRNREKTFKITTEPTSIFKTVPTAREKQNNNTVTPYDILVEEEKIATHFTDISISLGTLLTIAGGEALIFLVLLIVLGLYLKRFDLEKSGSVPTNSLSISTSLKRLRRHYKRKSQKAAGYRFGTTSTIPGGHLNIARPSVPAWRQIRSEEKSPKKSTNYKYPHRQGEINTVCSTVEAEINASKPKTNKVAKPYVYEEACTAFNVPSVDGRKSACPSEGRRYAAVIGELSETISKVHANENKEDEESMYALSAEDVYTDESSYDSSPITYENLDTHIAHHRSEERPPNIMDEKLKAFAENELEKIDEQIHILLHGLHGNSEGIESNV